MRRWVGVHAANVLRGAALVGAVLLAAFSAEALDPARSVLQVKPRLAETWVFYGLVVVSVGFAVFVFVRLRIARLVVRERELVLLVEKRTATLREEKERTERALQEAERQHELALAAGEAAEETSRTKSQLLANTSHELRTPLNAILGYSEMLMDIVRERGIDGLEEDLSRIHSAGRHLLGLINDILDLSKIEAGKMEILPEEVPVAALVEDVVAAVRPLAEKNGNRLDTFLPLKPGTIMTDPTRLRQILLNLLGNAAKFTTKGSAISRTLCQMMGGDLYVESERGKGTTFTVRLPAAVRLDTASTSS